MSSKQVCFRNIVVKTGLTEFVPLSVGVLRALLKHKLVGVTRQFRGALFIAVEFPVRENVVSGAGRSTSELG